MVDEEGEMVTREVNGLCNGALRPEATGTWKTKDLSVSVSLKGAMRINGYLKNNGENAASEENPE